MRQKKPEAGSDIASPPINTASRPHRTKFAGVKKARRVLLSTHIEFLSARVGLLNQSYLDTRLAYFWNLGLLVKSRAGFVHLRNPIGKIWYRHESKANRRDETIEGFS